MQETTYAYLGPQGTFSHEAAVRVRDANVAAAAGTDGFKDEPGDTGSAMGSADSGLIECATITDVFDLVDHGKATYGVVPIENALEGSVNETLDAFIFTSQAQIQRELVLDIHHNLIIANGADINDVNTVVSHPQALAQCHTWLMRNMPNAQTQATTSTGEAVRQAARDKNVAAIGTELAAKLFGAQVVKRDIEDHGGNQTCFVQIGMKPAERTWHDKTSLALFMKEDRPGTLLMILAEFAYAGLNLTKIQSRPTKHALGSYLFWIDVDGHMDDPDLKTALDSLRLKMREVKIIGSYPTGEVA